MTIRVRIVFPLWVGMQFRNSTWPGQKSRGLWDGKTRVVVAVIFRANEVVLLDVISWCVTACLESPGCFTENADNLCLLTGSDLVSTLRCVCVRAHACACARYACVTDDKTAHPKNVIHTCHIKQLCFCNYTLIPKLIYFSQKHISSSCAYFYMWGPSVGGLGALGTVCSPALRTRWGSLRTSSHWEGSSAFLWAKRHSRGEGMLEVIAISKADASLSFLAWWEPSL